MAFFPRKGNVPVSSAAAAGIARLALANAKTTAMVQEFVRDVQLRHAEARYRDTLSDYTDALARLSDLQLDYARLDTHYLLALRDLQRQALDEGGRWPEAQEGQNCP